MWGWLISFVGGKVLSVATGKWWIGPLIGLLVAGALGYGCYRIYKMGGDAREAVWVNRMTNIKAQYKEELDSKDKEIALIRSQRDTEIKAMNVLLVEQKRINDEELATLARRLMVARERIDALARIKPQEVIRYVTPDADRSCTIPAGFVFLHDKAAGADATKTSGAGVAASPPGDVNAPSGVALSTVGSVVANNYGEAAERGAIIELWQQWYSKVKASFEELKTKYNVLIEVPKSP